MAQEQDIDANDGELFPRAVEPMDQVSAHLDRGWDLISRGDYAGARVSAEKILEIDAQAPEAHNLLGYIEAASGNADDALECYRQAIDLDDGFVEAMLNAAELLIHPLGDFETALEMADDALDLAENVDETADVLLVMFDAHMNQGDVARARAVVEQLPDGPFENIRLKFLVGRAQFEAGLLERAAASLQKALELEPGFPDVHYYLGLVRERQEDFRGAALAFLRTRDLDLRQPRVRWALEEGAFEARVRSLLSQLPDTMKAVLDHTLVVISDVPGAEAVADGVDPRACVLAEDPNTSATQPRIDRLFVYQRNLERLATDLRELEEELLRALRFEIAQALPDHFSADTEKEGVETTSGEA